MHIEKFKRCNLVIGSKELAIKNLTISLGVQDFLIDGDGNQKFGLRL